MPTIEVNPGDKIKFLDGNGDLQEEFDYDTNNGVLVLQDSNGNPADQQVGNMDSDSIDNNHYREPAPTITDASGAVDLDLSNGNLFHIEAIDNITLSFSNVSSSPPGNSVTVYVTDHDGGGSYTISYPAGAVGNGGSLPGQVAQGSNIEIGIITGDGGSEYRVRKTGGGFA